MHTDLGDATARDKIINELLPPHKYLAVLRTC